MGVDLSSLYLFGEAFDRGSVRAEITCPYDNAELNLWISGQCTRVITLRQVEGGRPCDLIGTTSAFDLISSRIQEALTAEGIVGWKTCPVDLKDKKGMVIPGYGSLATTGRCGPLINSRSPKVRRMNVPQTQEINVWLGYYFDGESWDGSDMFRPEGTRMTIVTRRVKEVIEGIKATNIAFKPILEIERLVL